ncbi:MAG: DUF899 domain-containing protein [Pseudolabrys sp.]|nr:DUF899 domain-containing protein [Pseudolabrys sp.]
MTTHAIASQDQWLEARRDLLAAEKDLSRRSDQVAHLRRQLPWVRVEQDYVFEGPDGHQKLAELFDGRRQLLVQHFMLAPGWEEGCKSCSYMADHSDGMIPHLAQRDTAFVAISRAPYAEIVRFKRRMGWKFKWLSSNGSSFNYDFRVSFTPDEAAKGSQAYNYGSSPYGQEELPGVSVFFKDDNGDVFHTYSTYGRGVDVMMGTYRMLDLTPKGRDETGEATRMGWVRHHDRYEPVKTAGAACCGGPR